MMEENINTEAENSRIVMLVFGTRPEAIKMCPLVKELKRRPGIKTFVCVSGQHHTMLQQVLKAFNIVPDIDLAIMKDGQTLFDITERVLNGMRNVLLSVRPSLVLVHGDTSTAFASALAAFYLNIPVGHVEAGLRTYNVHSPYPEEFNRTAIGAIADYHFAPVKMACDNLIREGRNPERIWITGNTAIDALRTTVKDDYFHPELNWADGKRMILITAHRRENLGNPMYHMFRAIRRVLDEHDDVRALYPIHLNPFVRQMAEKVFGKSSFGGMEERIHIIEPLDVIDFHNLMRKSYLILTDSGGIQEEAPSLSIPVLVMRDTTERPEGIYAGTLCLTGTDEETIYNVFTRLLNDEDEYMKMAQASNPYGDGKACARIADVIEYGECREFC